MLQAVGRLKSYYQQQGHYDVKITTEEEEKTTEGELQLTFRIDPGPVYTLKAIDFAGVATGLLGLSLHARAERDRVASRTLELARVFEDHEALGGVALDDHLVEERVRQGRLARRGPAGEHDVLAAPDRLAQHLGLPRPHDLGGHVVGERVDQARPFPDHEHGGRGDRRKDPLEAVAVERELALHDGRAGVHDRAEH